MQPNQQDNNNWQSRPPTNDGYISSTGANIPEYLHMEPVVDPIANQKRRKRKKTGITAVAILFLLLAVIGVVAYWLIQHSDPQERFYRALESSMKVSYLNKEYNIKRTAGDELTVVSITTSENLSDPAAPQSDILRKYTKTQAGQVQKKYTTQAVADRSGYSIRIKDASLDAFRDDLIKEKWYRVPVSSNDDGLDQYTTDNETEMTINSVLGIVLTGNFNENSRASLLGYIKQNNTYDIRDSHQVDQDGKETTEYTIGIDPGRLNELNKKASEAIGIKRTFSLFAYRMPYEELKVSVDNSTDRIRSISYLGRMTKESRASDETSIWKKISLSYPTKAEITLPGSVKELPQ